MLKTIKSSLKDLSYFLKNPKDEQDISQSKQQKAKRLFSLLAIDIPIMMLLSILINHFVSLGWVELENHQVKLLLDLMPIGLVFFFTVIFIPFIEEIIFRLFLRFKRNFFLQIITSVFPQTKTPIVGFWNKKFGFVFYFSAIVFALIHITNYNSTSTIIYLIPILVLPQFISGLFIGYLRVRYNFMSGYLFHAIHNAIFITVALFSIEETSNLKLNLETDAYTLKIEEVSRVKTSFINNNNQDSISFIGTEFKSIISNLTNKDYDLIESNNKSIISRKITLNYRKKSSDSLNRESLILKHLGDIYSFKIEHKHRKQKVFNLVVQDSLQLFKYLSNTKNGINNTSTIVLSNKITFENTTLEGVAKTLSLNYENRFELKNEFSKKFNITLPNNNFTKLENTLKKDYGIYLEETNKELEYIYINFQK